MFWSKRTVLNDNTFLADILQDCRKYLTDPIRRDLPLSTTLLNYLMDKGVLDEHRASMNAVLASIQRFNTTQMLPHLSEAAKELHKVETLLRLGNGK